MASTGGRLRCYVARQGAPSNRRSYWAIGDDDGAVAHGGGSMPEIDVTTASCLLNETLTARTPPLSTRLQPRGTINAAESLLS